MVIQQTSNVTSKRRQSTLFGKRIRAIYLPSFSHAAAYNWIFYALLFLAFGLRLFQIEAQNIWGDEAWSITVANWSLAEAITSNAETNPPLYHILLHIAIRLFGQTPLGIRYLSVMCGVIVVASLTRLGREIAGRRLALWSGLITTLSPFLIYYAQEARMYGTALVGTTASLLVFVTLYKKQRSAQTIPLMKWCIYSVVSLVGVYSHYYAFAVLLAQAIMLTLTSLYQRKGHLLLPWIKTWFSMAVLFLPWLQVHTSFLESKASTRFNELTLQTFLLISRRTLLAFGGGTTLFATQAWWGWSIVLLALVGLIELSVFSKRKWVGLLSTIGLVTGLSFAWGLNPIMPFFWERYLLVIIPVFIIAVAAGVESLYRLWRPLAWGGLLLIVGTAILSLNNYYFDPAFVKDEYGQLMHDLRQQAYSDDLILLNNPLQASLYEYYGPKDIRAVALPREQLLADETTSELLSQLTRNYRRVWLVETGNRAEYDPQRRAQNWLSAHGSQGLFQSYRGATLSLFILSTASEINIPLNANFNAELLLTGYKLELHQPTAGGSLLLTLFWQAQQPMTHNYTIFTHLLDETGQVRAQMDSQPVGGTRPTATWAIGEIVMDNYALFLPENLMPGRYRLQVGVYLWPEMTRLPLIAEDGQVLDDKLILQEVLIE